MAQSRKKEEAAENGMRAAPGSEEKLWQAVHLRTTAPLPARA
jgi:hypothetical protein